MSLTTILAARSPAEASFTPQEQFGASHTLTISWGDSDGDGDQDAAVANYTRQKYLYINNGDGTFTAQAQWGVPKNTFVLVWGDYDNDGDLDLAEGRLNQTNALHINNGDGTFTEQVQFGAVARRTIAMAWGDYDNDGDLDLAVGNGVLGVNQQNYLYVNNGNGTFSEQAQFGLGQTDAVVWGDYDLDGDLDLAVGNGGFTGMDQQNYLYVNNGDGTFTQQNQFGTKDTAALAWGDADGDGDLDLAVGNWNAMGCALYLNNGDGTFTGQAQFGANDTNTLNWGDADNDGDLDLATGNGDFTSAGQNYLYLNDGAGVFTEIPEFGLGSTDGVSWADYDGDQDLDLAAGNEHSPEQNYLCVNNENDSNGLVLHLVGHFHDQGVPYSNRDGVGAKVEVFEAGFAGDPAHRLGFREVSASGGFSAQNPLEVHFGLPGRQTTDARITWPGSGGARIVQVVPGIAVGQRITIEEEQAASGVSPASGGLYLNTLRAAPNPMRGRVRFELAPAPGSPGGIEIYDPAGKLVRVVQPGGSIAAGERARGRHLIAEWDGVTDDGHAVPTGVYLVRISGSGRMASARVVVVR